MGQISSFFSGGQERGPVSDKPLPKGRIDSPPPESLHTPFSLRAPCGNPRFLGNCRVLRTSKGTGDSGHRPHLGQIIVFFSDSQKRGSLCVTKEAEGSNDSSPAMESHIPFSLGAIRRNTRISGNFLACIQAQELRLAPAWPRPQASRRPFFPPRPW